MKRGFGFIVMALVIRRANLNLFTLKASIYLSFPYLNQP